MNTTSKLQTKDIAIEGMMITLVFLGTFYFKIPSLFGYTHLGDSMIILSVCLLGTKKGAFAGALGAGLADLLGGYTAWVIPTMTIKAIWVLVMGAISFKLLKGCKYNLWIGAFIGAIFHITLYTLIKFPMFGVAYAISSLPLLTLQTLSGIIIGNCIYSLIKNKLNYILK